MQKITTFDELVNRFEQYEKLVTQLVRIVGVSNKRISELTDQIESLQKDRVY